MRTICPGVFEGGNPGSVVSGVPVVSMRQAQLALLAAGKLSAVNAAINAMSEPERSAARIEFDRAGTVARDHPSTAMIGAAAGLNSAEIDALFTAARQIE